MKIENPVWLLALHCTGLSYLCPNPLSTHLVYSWSHEAGGCYYCRPFMPLPSSWGGLCST